MYDITQYTALADAQGFGVAFPTGGSPDALAAPWNVANAGESVCGAGNLVQGTGDDFGFIDAMKVDVAEDQCLDTSHVFSTGFSMGGYFTHHIGCYRSDMRAVAPHSGGTLADLSACTTGHVPIIIFHGTADPVIDDACDDPTVPGDTGFPHPRPSGPPRTAARRPTPPSRPTPTRGRGRRQDGPVLPL